VQHLLSFLFVAVVSIRLTPRLEEAQWSAVRRCLMRFPSHSVLKVNHTVETMSVCLSVLIFKLENSQKDFH
jgi:hypothetical protein